jgi:hypothetical protein
MSRHGDRRSGREKPGGLLRRFTATLLAGLAPSAAIALEAGDRAPDFHFAGSDGRTYTLAGLLEDGRQGIVLAFFPKAFTPG